jgi:membrane associated rhomboid family serine protease
MAPRRARFALPEFLTFGGRVPASIGLALAVSLLLSIYAWQNRAFAGLVALSPGNIASGELWRLVTWPFVQGDPFGLIFVALTFWWLGPQLMWGWGQGRFWLRLLAITVGAAVVPTLLAFVWPGAGVPHVGAWPIMNAMLVVWAMRVPDAQLNIWGVVPVTARTLALFVVGGTVLYALFSGLGSFLPHFSALVIAWAITQGLSPGRLLGRAQESFREQARARRARHLKVVKKNNPGDDKPTWMN